VLGGSGGLSQRGRWWLKFKRHFESQGVALYSPWIWNFKVFPGREAVLVTHRVDGMVS